MFGSGILDTVIGLIFVFLLVSLFVTIINELIASVLKSRAKWLRRGIERLIGAKWMKDVYDHPLIKGSGLKDKGWFLDPGPSYIPSRSFANVLMSVVQQNASELAKCQEELRNILDQAAGVGATVDSLVTQLSAQAATLAQGSNAQKKVAADLVRHLDARPNPDMRGWLDEVNARVDELRRSGRQGLTPLLDGLNKLVVDGRNATLAIDVLRQRFDAAVTTLGTSPDVQVLKDQLVAMGKRLQGPYTVGDAYTDIRWFIDGLSARYVREMIEAVPDGQLKKSLLTLYQDAGNDIEKFKENIEVWFNNGMDRVNGWYKRRVQWVSLAVAMVTVVAMNVDAILVFRHLQTYSGVREGIVAQATQFAQKNPAPTPGPLTVANGESFSGKVTLKTPGKPQPPRVAITTSNPKATTVTPESVPLNQDSREIEYRVDVHTVDDGLPATATIDFGGAADPVTLTLVPSLLRQMDTVEDKLMNLALPIGWVRAAGTDAEKAGDSKKPAAPVKPTSSAKPAASSAKPAASSEKLAAEKANGQVLPRWGSLKEDGLPLLAQHGLGWLLTALAATLGAPFWFDLLNRIISIRAAGKPPEEEPKPPKTVSVPVEPGQSKREADWIRQGEPRTR
ncbi:hypothetical protein FBX97_5129 [Herbaspirillum sp. SJZ107]|nr:hypothetical protein FBX97_5129 [Herbaspirillum sp. SJZ107]